MHGAYSKCMSMLAQGVCSDRLNVAPHLISNFNFIGELLFPCCRLSLPSCPPASLSLSSNWHDEGVSAAGRPGSQRRLGQPAGRSTASESPGPPARPRLAASSAASQRVGRQTVMGSLPSYSTSCHCGKGPPGKRKRELDILLRKIRKIKHFLSKILSLRLRLPGGPPQPGTIPGMALSGRLLASLGCLAWRRWPLSGQGVQLSGPRLVWKEGCVQRRLIGMAGWLELELGLFCATGDVDFGLSWRCLRPVWVPIDLDGAGRVSGALVPTCPHPFRGAPPATLVMWCM